MPVWRVAWERGRMNQIRQAIAALGTDLGPHVLDQCRALFDDEQMALLAHCVSPQTQ